MGLIGKDRAGELIDEKTFADAAKLFLAEFQILTDGSRNAKYVACHHSRVRLYLRPFFGNTPLSKITPGLIQDYRLHRHTDFDRPPAKSTLHQEIVVLRQILKTAVRRGWITSIPDMSAPYNGSVKIGHRAWFSPDEYKKLYKATREATRSAIGDRNKYMTAQLHDQILFMTNTGIRPDEAKRLEYRDVEIVEDEDTNETILLISVRGKRGIGYCKSMPGAVLPFQRMMDRNKPNPTDLMFSIDHRSLFNRILADLDLKFDREGNRRTLYSLRHSYISFRLLEGADIYMIAKNCRTSVEMIEKHYARHLANAIDASAINVRKANK